MIRLFRIYSLRILILFFFRIRAVRLSERVKRLSRLRSRSTLESLSRRANARVTLARVSGCLRRNRNRIPFGAFHRDDCRVLYRVFPRTTLSMKTWRATSKQAGERLSLTEGARRVRRSSHGSLFITGNLI